MFCVQLCKIIIIIIKIISCSLLNRPLTQCFSYAKEELVSTECQVPQVSVHSFLEPAMCFHNALPQRIFSWYTLKSEGVCTGQRSLYFSSVHMKAHSRLMKECKQNPAPFLLHCLLQLALGGRLLSWNLEMLVQKPNPSIQHHFFSHPMHPLVKANCALIVLVGLLS